MKEYFDIVLNKLIEGLGAGNYSAEEVSTAGSRMTAVIRSADTKLLLEYSNRLFSLYRGAAGDSSEDLQKVQTYLFDASAGDGAREASGVANEFLDTLQSSSAAAAAPQTQQRRRSKNKDSDENDAIFFVNRLVTALPECRAALQSHKAHYEQVLPRCFCEDVVVRAQREMMRSGSKYKISEYFQLLDAMYTKGDLDVRSIIMQVLLAAVDKSDYSFVEEYFSDDNKKAWAAARRLYGRKVRPEQKSAMAKLAAYQAENLNGMRS